jgi:hypothetical protein
MYRRPRRHLWWSNLEILLGPLHRSSPFIGELRCQAIQTEHGPYMAERTQKAVYIVRCLCGCVHSSSRKRILSYVTNSFLFWSNSKNIKWGYVCHNRKNTGYIFSNKCLWPCCGSGRFFVQIGGQISANLIWMLAFSRSIESIVNKKVQWSV